ncbi:FUSC family protein [Paludibacterium paludis]|uniref:FUSC family protein n=1 Tax=Paludibacterium paludis TaxID=1225769 RepID=A0A918P612_9NEIS|nr:FUSC family protein [Paludibacterium paludis]GGY21455.1 FUSC family protein [Paludibacterium paludis]
MRFAFSLPDPMIQWERLWLTVLGMLPAVLLFLATGEAVWLKEAFIAVYLMIVVNRLGPSVARVLGQATLIAVSIELFILAEPHATVFVLLCAGYASVSSGIGMRSANAATFTTYLFLPAFYLGCELASRAAPHAAFWHGYLAAVIPPALIAWRLAKRHGAAQTWRSCFARQTPDTRAYRQYRDAAIIRFIAVLVAASWVKISHIEPEKWVIWSSASVSTGELATSLRKHRDRLIGVLAGVPVGIVLAHVLPAGPVLYSVCLLLIGVSIDTIKHYPLAFGLRGTLCVLASSSLQEGVGIGMMRVEDVILGGLIGLAVSLIWHSRPARATQ